MKTTAEALCAWLAPQIADGRRAYMVLDAARDPAVLPFLAENEDALELACLYRGDDARDLADVAPWLVAFDPDAPVCRQLAARAWGHAWGIFALAPVDLKPLRRHFQTLLEVRTEDDRILLFRFYDPRVLRGFLPIATAEQLPELFGPVTRFIAEDRDPTLALSFDSRGNHLDTASHRLTEGA